VTSWDQHQAIFDAIADGDAERARQHTFHHMESVVRDLVGRTAPERAAR
jgi:DNA-binding GntR family transcriptional regulator